MSPSEETPDRPDRAAESLARELSRLRTALDGLGSARLEDLARTVEALARRRTADDSAPHLEQLAAAVRELAADQRELHAQIAVVANMVERRTRGEAPRPLAAPALGEAGGEPPPPARWRRLAKRLLRSTLGLARRAWQAAGPEAGGEPRLVLVDSAATLPPLARVLVGPAPRGDELPRLPGEPARVLVWEREQSLCRLLSPQGEELGQVHARGLSELREAAGGTALLEPLGMPAPPPADLEAALLVLGLEDLLFVELQLELHGEQQEAAGGGPLVLVRASLWHPEEGVESATLARLARERPGRVLGKVLRFDDESRRRTAPGSALSLPAGVEGSGAYLVAAGGERPGTHRVHTLPPAELGGPGAADSRPGVLLLASAPLTGGLERVVADLARDLGRDCRPLLVDLAPPCRLGDERQRLLGELSLPIYRLGRVLPPPLWPAAIHTLLAGRGIGRLLHFGEPAAPGLLEALRRRLPELVILDHPRSAAGGSAVADRVLRFRLDREGLAPGASGHLGVYVEGLEAEASAGRRETLRRELGLGPEDLAVAMLADLVAEERPEDFLRLAHHLREDARFHFFLIGRGPLGPSLADLRRFLATPRLRLLAGEGEVAGTLAAMDIACSTAETHPFPHALAAALALGRPVVAAGRAGEALEAAGCGLAVAAPDDLEGYTRALERLADPELRQGIALPARQVALGCPWPDALETYRGLLRLGDTGEGP